MTPLGTAPFRDRLGRLTRSPRLRRWLAMAILPAALWAIGYHTFLAFKPNKHSLTRIDWSGAKAYPMSDAGCDFQNGLALLSGDGWVNWRITNRWSVYKPGWGATLGLLAALTGRDTGRMQWIITLVLSGFVPLFYLVLLTLFPGPRSPPIAALTALLVIVYPTHRSWWFMHEMMTEGPTLLVGLAFCWLALRLARLPAAALWPGLLLGMLGAYLALVRGQALYGVIAVVGLLVVARIRRPRRALRLAALFVGGFVAIAGPLYLKTSIHLGQPYFGTSYYALVTMLDWTAPGEAVGGSKAAIAGIEDEGARIQAMSRQTRVAAAYNLSRGRGWWRDAIDISKRTLLDSPKKLLRLPQRRLLELALLAGLALGVWAATRHHGLAGLVPLAFWAGYIAPNVLFSYYLPRFAAPVGWVGPAYLAGALMLWLNGRPRRESGEEELSGDEPARPRAQRFPVRPLAVVALWLVAATAVLMWLDLRPRPDVDVARLLDDPRTRSRLQSAGIELDPELRAEIEAAINDDRLTSRVHVGIAHLPIVMRPRQSALRRGWMRLEPPVGGKAYTAFLSMSPWKEDDHLKLWVVAVPRQLYRGFRHGDRLVAILSDEQLTPPVDSFLPKLQAAVVFPVRWPEEP